MPLKRRNFQRPLGGQHYRKLFVIAVEGVKTEPQYFSIFNVKRSVIQVNCLKGNNNSSPLHVLKRMKDYLKQKELKSSDEAWLVVDKDQWTDEQLDQLFVWAQAHNNYGFALSNPKFEYWLLLHFEDGNDIVSSQNCSDRLKQCFPSYDKGIDIRKITHEQINNAIYRARKRDHPPCVDWPHAFGGTTVYKLVESIFESERL
jgi:hypothetical protein